MTRLFHVSDLHFGTEDRDALAWFAAAVAAEQPDAVIMTGDLTAAARRREFTAACEWLVALNVPVTVELGNHDMPLFNLWERFTDPTKRFDRLERTVERPLVLPGVSIVPLRTATRAQLRRNWAEGIVRPHRLAETLALLAKAPPENMKIVAGHHPLGGLGSRHRTRGGRRALAALAATGVDAVLSGHTHEPFDIVVDGVRLIGAGTLSERIRVSPPSFNELTIDAGSIGVVARVME
ncbi:metallophosphoesterase [Polymorphobacter sp. PAMC 29334]|uniref:metallophosphoesterase family protein n=1 Tax=Polymorphobacter sp. PAMC 29334 TaxID=2862331 RepID=UPI001C665C19|nr:metallophosphoesterase [Polymorphobacter sp. PAMC 29334]QYE35258.1 metallophosphoesterase [Polymorphobacter sp. PAMC 29334]